jgi:thioredoxin-related protein
MTWQEAMEAREKEPKKIFIDVYTDWCGWCKKMDASTFVDPIIVEYMNANFYAVKLNAEMHDSIQFRNMLFVNQNPTAKRGTHMLAISLLNGKLSYPSFVVMDENVNRLMILAGFQQVPALYNWLMFFGSNNHIRYQQYLSNEQNARQQNVQQQ